MAHLAQGSDSLPRALELKPDDLFIEEEGTPTPARPIGAGSYGLVYLGHYKRSTRVAIKKLQLDKSSELKQVSVFGSISKKSNLKKIYSVHILRCFRAGA